MFIAFRYRVGNQKQVGLTLINTVGIRIGSGVKNWSDKENTIRPGEGYLQISGERHSKKVGITKTSWVGARNSFHTGEARVA